MSKKVIIIGSGFAGLSAACFMAKAGWQVTVLEKHEQPGGRARQLKTEGFTFDMGPSWYWMPDVFEKFFAQFGKKVADYYTLKRLDPSYRIFWKCDHLDMPANYDELRCSFERLEKDSADNLDEFLTEAAYKYSVGMEKLVYKPGLSATELLDWDIIKKLGRLDVFNSMSKHVDKYFQHPKLRQVLKFPVLFLGAMPSKIPALYSLMNHADAIGGTWYPKGGMYKIVEGMYSLAKELGVEFRFNQNVTAIKVENGNVSYVLATDIKTKVAEAYKCDVIIGAADYHHIEQHLLEPQYQSYAKKYWESRTMAPSCLLYYVGLNKKIPGLKHHSLFFDADFEMHEKEIYKTETYPADPLFYMCAASVTDDTVAPEGCENLFLLIPVAAGLANDSTELRDKYFDIIITRAEEKLQTSIKDAIVYKKDFALSDFVSEYNAFKGNAYGLANTLWQTAVLKPKCRSRKVKNLFYAGQLTVPGPGVPPALISGEVVANEVVKAYGRKADKCSESTSE